MPPVNPIPQDINVAAQLLIHAAEAGDVVSVKNGQLCKAGLGERANLALRSIFLSKSKYYAYLDRKNQAAIRSFIDLCQQSSQLANRPETNSLIESRFQSVKNLTPVLSNHILRGDIDGVLDIVNVCFNKTNEAHVLADIQIHDAQLQIDYIAGLDIESKLAYINSETDPLKIEQERKDFLSIQEKLELGKKIAAENPECLNSPVIAKNLDEFIAASTNASNKIALLLERFPPAETPPVTPEGIEQTTADSIEESHANDGSIDFEFVENPDLEASNPVTVNNGDEFEDLVRHDTAIPSTDELQNQIIENRKVRLSNDAKSGLPSISLHAYKTQEAASVLQLFSGKSHQDKLKATQFLAKRIYPHKIAGKLKNLIDLFKEAVGRRNPQWALRRNCVQCSFAVDLFLEQVEKPEPKLSGIYKAGRQKGNFGNRLDHYGVADIRQGILDHVPPNTRAIFTVSNPEKNTSHAMNVVRDEFGATFVIDGQIGRVYDLGGGSDGSSGNPKDLRDFVKAHQTSAAVDLGIWSRGAAPSTWSTQSPNS